jgi:hypothetical protein
MHPLNDGVKRNWAISEFSFERDGGEKVLEAAQNAGESPTGTSKHPLTFFVLRLVHPKGQEAPGWKNCSATNSHRFLRV